MTTPSGNAKVRKGKGSAPSITERNDTTIRGTHWSITINNPTEEDLDAWKNMTIHHWVKEVKGQLERGANGTPHIQGYLRTAQVRLSQIKAILPRAHIEQAKNVTALVKYVSKEDTRVASIEATKVATPQIVQTYLSDYVINEILTQGEQFVEYKRVYDPEERKLVWKPEPQVDYDRTELGHVVAIIKLNHAYLLANANSIVDKVVRQMITQGYFMVEFIMSNNQVRTAYKHYLPEIIIRNATQTSESQQEEANHPEANAQDSQEVD